ncbi:peptidoglycan-associated lipoprotein Pal [Alcanivorax sp. S6407]|uniref:peptidoglycan-associated lipoprotein Pal n=1 Tax=Alcanivorax sp. S6407 TaxID=2926424 RepID=UPI001FF59491|nr:peptidoglycan-associated lipoprotein Pal [Alcanivorax sp. S6407]MCK0155478.1 peptidoglycan-associated lipoprotein Pal [Alcanivorax sp. S6407]
MRSFLNPLFALMLAAALAACSSTPTEEDTSATDTTEPTEVAPVTPVEPTAPAKPDTSSIPMTADNFYNHPSNYDGTTNTKVIYFAFDSNTVPAAAFETLRAHATYLKNNANAKVRLEGHADERGTREYNVALSERRSKAVEKFLRVQGVSASQIEVVSYGEEKPAAFGHSEMDWAKNRRVELNYTAGRP